MLNFAESLFSIFATAAFLEFVIFALFELRFLLMLWKARHPEAFSNGIERLRRELFSIYFKFCQSFISMFCVFDCLTAVFYVNGRCSPRAWIVRWLFVPRAHKAFNCVAFLFLGPSGLAPVLRFHFCPFDFRNLLLRPGHFQRGEKFLPS